MTGPENVVGSRLPRALKGRLGPWGVLKDALRAEPPLQRTGGAVCLTRPSSPVPRPSL